MYLNNSLHFPKINLWVIENQLHSLIQYEVIEWMEKQYKKLIHKKSCQLVEKERVKTYGGDAGESYE